MDKKKLKYLFAKIDEKFEWFRQKAKRTGKAVDFFNLGLIYEYKQTNHMNLKKAIKYYTRASNLGHARAQCNLGVLYQHGQGTEDENIDARKACYFYQLAAKQDDVFGLCNLGLSYLDGEGIELNEKKGIQCLKRASDLGFSRADYFLGTYYLDGTGVPRDLNKAVELWKKAANNGFPYAQVALGEHYYEGIAHKDVKEAFSWYRKAADQGDGWGMFLVGYLYENELESLGIVADGKREATKWFQLAVDSGEQNGLGSVDFGYVVGSRSNCNDVEESCLVIMANRQNPPSLLPELWTKILHSLLEHESKRGIEK